ncbi:hepatocyte growth factor activator, partial [Clarias magur]
RKQPPGIEIFTSTQSVIAGQKVLTIEGRECKFPFRWVGTLYHQCVTSSPGIRWCSLTNNFDRDMEWGYCRPQPHHSNTVFNIISEQSLCRPNPCKNGGMCMAVHYRRLFECVCPDAFTGAKCELKKCYEPLHLRYYNIGEAWGRIHLRNVEQCVCSSDGMSCMRARYRECFSNPCENEGTCRVIETTGKAVCACRPGYRGPYCSISPEENCYKDSGAEYRGTTNVTLSGAPCLPWSSDLMYNELSVDTVHDASLRGLGDHAFCRNPDNDKKPWCYTMNNGVISWEYCDIPSCLSALSSRKAPAPTSPPTPAPIRKPNCGKRHPKRVSRGRILGGTPAMSGAHPWMAALYINEEFCAGTLVAGCWVVSAAHCFNRNPLLSKIRVVLGQHVFNDSGSTTQTYGVEKYMFYDLYNQFSPTVHDIALVKLKKVDGRCAHKNKFVRPICLPDKSMTFPDYTCCTISGWGHIQERGDTYSSLREGTVKLIPHEKCSSDEVYGSEVREGMLCAGSSSCVDACQ